MQATDTQLKHINHFHFIVLKTVQKELAHVAKGQIIQGIKAFNIDFSSACGEETPIPFPNGGAGDNKNLIYFTEQCLNALALIDNKLLHQRFCQFLLTDLCRYPAQGRLLLNRSSIDPEVNQLRHQIAADLNSVVVRDLLYEDWLIVYLSSKSTAYVLNLFSFKNSFADALPLWLDGD